jgi:hypothetical protein
MKGRRETLVVATAAILFGVVFGILFLACEQREAEPDARAEAPASAEAKPDSPPAPSASKVAVDTYASFNDIHSRVRELGVQIEGLRGKATGDLEVALEELVAKQAQLMDKLERIGGENDEWDAVRAELRKAALDLRSQLRRLAGRVRENG